MPFPGTPLFLDPPLSVRRHGRGSLTRHQLLLLLLVPDRVVVAGRVLRLRDWHGRPRRSVLLRRPRPDPHLLRLLVLWTLVRLGGSGDERRHVGFAGQDVFPDGARADQLQRAPDDGRPGLNESVLCPSQLASRRQDRGSRRGRGQLGEPGQRGLQRVGLGLFLDIDGRGHRRRDPDASGKLRRSMTDADRGPETIMLAVLEPS